MSVTIGHASINENGTVSNGQAGDQTQKEVCTRSWYSKPWSLLLRPVNADIAEKSAKACEQGCANNQIGYDQPKRNTLHTEAQKTGYDLSKITTACSCDCSSFMTVCAIAGGVTELEYTSNAPTTSTMAKSFVATGKYQQLTDSKYLTSDQYLKRGDILVKPGSHTVMVLTNGDNAQPKPSPTPTPNGYPMRGVDVSKYQTNLNYQSFKNAGVQFAIIKITQKDNQKDPLFETHYNGFTNVGIPVIGCYNYSYATSVDKARQDAKAVIQALNGRKMTVFFDTEDKCQQGIGHTLIDIINAYQEVIEGAGLSFAIYSGLSYTKSFLLPYISDLRCKDIWMARYYNGYNTMYIDSPLDESKKPVVNGFNLIGWQYTSSGRINGYNGNLDMSIMYQGVTPTPGPKPIKTGYCNTHALNIRNQPSTSGQIVGYLTEGMKVAIYEEQNGWYRISPNESKWVSGKYITLY